jgi:acetolactate synthase-1/3 small subunit
VIVLPSDTITPDGVKHVTSSPDLSEPHTIAVLVANEPGVLARVIGLFSGRGYNITSLTVSEVDDENSLSRITIVTSGTPMVIEQIKAQLGRLVPVYEVHDLTSDGVHLERELALVKIVNSGEDRIEALRIADTFRARALDSTLESFVFELTGTSPKIDAFINLMLALGRVEVSRTGVAAIARGEKVDMEVTGITPTRRQKPVRRIGK